MTETGRLFVAVDLPEEIRRGLADWARLQVGRRDDLRRVPADALHLTLAFLGDRPMEEADALGDAVLAAADGPVALGIDGALWLPPRRPHVLTVALTDPAGALAGLHGRVHARLAEAVGFVPDERRFRPHVTVARVRRGARVRPVSLDPPAPQRFAAAAVGLYRSRLGTGGPQYEALARAELPVPG